MMERRQFLKNALLVGGGTLIPEYTRAAAPLAPSARGLQIAPFRFDVTPPIGHSLCGGWIKPAAAVDDPLEAIGYVLLGSGRPLVFCAVDWTGILNDAHREWRSALAEAAGTTPDRVSVHCVHQHNAPLVCFEAGSLVAAQPDLPKVFEVDFHRRCLDEARRAVAEAIPRARAVTQIARGEALVEAVASNRRVARDSQGRVTVMRGSACRDSALVAQPEGLVDPRLRTIAFYDRETKVVACHFYATHPMSYYGDGRVSSDFCGLARKRRQQDEPRCTHLYFTGCAGNIAAGKYNDGSPAARTRLTERMYRAIVAAEAQLQPEPIDRVEWRTHDIVPAPNPALGSGALAELMTKQRDAVVLRMRPAFKLAFIHRCERGLPLTLGALRVNDVTSLYLPAEPFVEFQLRAQEIAHRPVAVAAYGDNGPWYVPTASEFPHGGYEVEHAFAQPGTESAINAALQSLLG